MYDQQFTLRLVADPIGISFANIDYELWLIYIGGPVAGSANLINENKCYDFTYR